MYCIPRTASLGWLLIGITRGPGNQTPESQNVSDLFAHFVSLSGYSLIYWIVFQSTQLIIEPFWFSLNVPSNGG